jgi:hypothetical protein
MKPRILILLLLGVLLAGCGGGASQAIGDITGFIQDIDGNPVRDARVYVDGGPQTYSNSAGSYRLEAVFGDYRTIKATTTQDGASYYGETVVQLFNNETSKSTNITLVPSAQRATLRGTVRDRNGLLVEGAHVFAAAVNSSGVPTVWSSTVAITDADGFFQITTLLGGRDTSVIASARTFDSDTEIVNVAAGNSQTLDFTLRNATDPLLNPPANVEAIAWTTPWESTTRSVSQRQGIEAIKNLIEPRRRSWRRTRDTSGGNYVEIDLDWTPMADLSLIGFEIYRGFGDVPYNNLQPIDFYRDPQASLYEDLDPNFHEGQTYTYAMTALNTHAPNSNNSESDFSNRVVVTTLDDMTIDPVTTGPITFHWQSGSGATNYQVFVFDRFPSIGVNSVWNGTTAGTQLAYGGPATSGHTYYYVVLGTANSGFSKTLSLIDSFVAP